MGPPNSDLAGMSREDAWSLVQEASRRYNRAARRLPLVDAEVRTYRQEYIAALSAYRASIKSVR